MPLYACFDLTESGFLRAILHRPLSSLLPLHTGRASPPQGTKQHHCHIPPFIMKLPAPRAVPVLLESVGGSNSRFRILVAPSLAYSPAAQPAGLVLNHGTPPCTFLHVNFIVHFSMDFCLCKMKCYNHVKELEICNKTYNIPN